MVAARALVIALALSLAFAGCFRKGGEEEGPLNTSTTNETQNSAVLPDGRGQSAGILETNATEEGVGGVEHKHDYWQGKDRVLLFQDTVFIGCPPCMPDGEGTQPKAVGYVKLGDLPGQEGTAAMVYEGAASVEILFGAPLALEFQPIPHPAPPSFFLQYRSAADAEWTAPEPITLDAPIVVPLTTLMTDMPHSTHSLWVFRISTDRPEPNIELPMEVTVVKGREVLDWPGHPDFYADNVTVRKVMDQHVTTHMSGLESAALYDSGGTWATPEKLISWGTKEIRVFVNITSTTNAYNAEPTGYFLEAHNATIIGPEVTFGSRHGEINDKNDLQSYEFVLKVTDEGMDGPYQPASRWGFRAMATFADFQENPTGISGLCPGCFPYDIEYDIVVLATNVESGVAEDMEEI